MEKDKVIRADQGGHTYKLLNLGSIIGLIFIVLTAGFMVFQNMKIGEERNKAEVIATAFAEQIQLMCLNPEISDSYGRICTLAGDFADNEYYLGENQSFTWSEDIDKITCSKGQTIIQYEDGTEAVADVQCDTDQG